MQRLSMLLIPGLIATALFIGISSFDATTTESDINLQTTGLDFDAYSEGINSVLYDETGSISYTLQADRQIHFNDDITEFDAPFIRLYEDGKSGWNIVADSGKISARSANQRNADQTIDLTGNVEVHSRGEAGNTLVISTEFLTVNPDRNSLETEAAVKIVTAHIEQTGVGMFADLGQDVITLKADIRGKYEAPL
jgi:LPS export ABC transporter protein LptC